MSHHVRLCHFITFKQLLSSVGFTNRWVNLKALVHLLHLRFFLLGSPIFTKT